MLDEEKAAANDAARRSSSILVQKMKARNIDMYEWKDVTGFFSEKERHYKDTYLEIDEVYDEKIEVSLFSSPDGVYELYVSYGKMCGIIYVEAEKADLKREEVKNELAQEYQKHKEPTGEFINAFCEKHELDLLGDEFCLEFI